jgi:hypothetical protein
MNPKSYSSTQKFTEIVDISENIVVLQGDHAAIVIEIQASNFSLLSEREQEAKIIAYASLLNSLTFPIQILIRNKLVDISSYVKELEEVEKRTKNALLANHIKLYRSFVHEMIRVNVVLNKMFYIVIPYSPLEAGVTQAVPGASSGDLAVNTAKKILKGKADSLLPQIKKLAMSARILNKEELIKLFFDEYNEGAIQPEQAEEGIKDPLIHPKQ